MKKNSTLLSYILFSMLLVFSSCTIDDEVSPEHIALNNLSGTWTINNATTPDGNVALSGVLIDFNSEKLNIVDPDGFLDPDSDYYSYEVSGLEILNSENLNYNGETNIGPTVFGIFEKTGYFTLISNQTELKLTNIEITSLTRRATSTVVDFNILDSTITLSYQSPVQNERDSTRAITLTGSR